MTLTLFETIQKIVQQEIGRIRTAELGVVQEQHPHADDSDSDNYSCTVVLRDSEIVLNQVPVATQRIGTASIPAVGELVLVQFLGGDINAPIITGRLYNDEDRPPVNDDNQGIIHLPLGAEDSDAVHIELHSGDRREIVVKLGDGLAIKLHDDDPVFTMDIDGGKGMLQIDRDGAVKIETDGDIEILGNAITIEGQGDLNLKGATVNIEGDTINLN